MSYNVFHLVRVCNIYALNGAGIVQSMRSNFQLSLQTCPVTRSFARNKTYGCNYVFCGLLGWEHSTLQQEDEAAPQMWPSGAAGRRTADLSPLPQISALDAYKKLLARVNKQAKYVLSKASTVRDYHKNKGVGTLQSDAAEVQEPANNNIDV